LSRGAKRFETIGSRSTQTPRYPGWLGTGEVIPGSYSESEHELMLAQWQHHGFGWRSAIDAESGEWIGATGLNYIGENPSGLPAEEIEFGWWLKPSHWGRGLATEAAMAIRDEAFTRDITHHLWARHNTRNRRSGRVMEKIGMRFVRDAPGAAGVTMQIFQIRRADWENLMEGREGVSPQADQLRCSFATRPDAHGSGLTGCRSVTTPP
jgi:RimJ/RimL family protein N-acetyltransferase